MKFIHPNCCYWDIAGVNGLQVVRQLLGSPMERIAPFQSVETQLHGHSCSVLRLCENNFRIGWSGDSAEFQALIQPLLTPQVWVKQFDWLAVMVLLEPSGWSDFDWSQIAVAKPPHRLNGLATHCAAPARLTGCLEGCLEGKALLIWRHPVLGQPAVELHTAACDQGSIKTYLESVLESVLAN